MGLHAGMHAEKDR